jgi:hypothetical protein
MQRLDYGLDQLEEPEHGRNLEKLGVGS